VKLVFADAAWEDYIYWADADAKTLTRLNSLIEECRRNPFAGAGKPEPLRGDLQGWWSRRITKADRLVYRVAGKGLDQRLEIAQCRFHY
jgi:toxin YoeB